MLIRFALALCASLHLACSDASEPPMVQEPPPPAISAASAETATEAQEAAAPIDSPTLAEWMRSAQSGSLILRTPDGGKLSAGAQLSTEIEVSITGTIARASIRQKFSNPSELWAEGFYVFPLPDDAAVDHMRVLTDGRVIEGLIQEKEEARKIYEAAKAEGKRAGLVEQERPNIFTTSIANIRPRSEVTVEIEYQQSVQLDDGQFSVRIPTVVAPRYLLGATETEAALPATTHPVEIEIDLAPGFDLETLESPYHSINTFDDGHTYHVTLADGPVPGDRDFVLQWIPSPNQEPEAVVFTETLGTETYALMMVSPPFIENTSALSIPREVIYVIDTSGSMAGASLAQAKSALALALERLDTRDRFNLIQFNSTTSALFEQSRVAHSANVDVALDYVAKLKADGGTDIAPAIRLALTDPMASKGGELRQVVFLTDGSVGNEAELLEEIQASLGNSRVFAIGIGSAPNTFFMRKLAQFGRGSFTYIGDPNEVADKMTTLFYKLESAVLADVRIELPESATVEMYPYEIPDLYVGEPVVVAVKLDTPLERVSVTGWTGDSRWEMDIDPWSIEERPGIHVLWARQAIEERMDDRVGSRDEELLAKLRAEVVALAIDHHLVSAYTSLVAVDRSPDRARGEDLAAHRLGAILPSSWQSDASFGFAQGATPAGLQIGIGLLFTAAGLAWRKMSS